MKKTPFGLIPEDWKIGDVSDAGKVVTGSTPPTSDPGNYGIDIPFVTPKEVGASRYVGETSRGLSAIGASKARLLPANSVVFVCIGSTIGKVSQISRVSATNQQINAIACNGHSDPGFLYYQLDFRARHIRQFAGTQAVPIISKGLFEQIPLLFPPLPEQKKIAKILGACDAAIEAQERLIALKRQRKKGLMQQLLTGKIRFPRFIQSTKIISSRFFDYPTDWRFLKIEDIVVQVNRRNSFGELPVLSCTKHSGLVDSLSYFQKQVFAEDTSGYKVVERGEFAFATNHLEEGSIGYQDLYDRAIISPIYCVFKTRKNVRDAWLYPLLKTELYRHIFEANTNASVNRRGSIRWKEFKCIHVALPSLGEQDEIASVLSAQDEVIALQQTKLEQLKQRKKGLMQRLLTGKVRVMV